MKEFGELVLGFLLMVFLAMVGAGFAEMLKEFGHWLFG